MRHITVNVSQITKYLYLCSSQVTEGSGMSSSVTPDRMIVIRYVEPQAEEEVVPDEHLHVRRLPRV